MENSSNKPKQIIPFTPVPVRARHDGWTVEKQIAFIEALAETGVVEEACRRVGMSRTSADNLRRRPCGMQFRQAWEAAIDYSLYRIEEEVFGRARHGVARPVFYRGEQVGEYRHFDERLTMFLLRTRRPRRYGRWIDKAPAPGARPRRGGLRAGGSRHRARGRPDRDRVQRQGRAAKQRRRRTLCPVSPAPTHARALRSQLSQLPARANEHGRPGVLSARNAEA